MSVIKDDDVSNLGLTRRQIEAKAIKLRAPLKWGDSVSEDTSKPMLQPIASVPRNGTLVMVYCPGEVPEHVGAKWAGAKNEDGTVAWEGLVFADELLADVCPLGPQGATHWYNQPQLDTRISTARPVSRDIDPDQFRQEYLTEFDPDLPHRRFTVAQLEALHERGIKPAKTKIFWLEQEENERISDYISSSIYDESTVVLRVKRTPCPILLDYRPKSDDAYIVYPHGDIGLVRFDGQKS